MHSERVAEQLDAGDACGARTTADELQRLTIAAVNTGRVPARYQEELAASVGSLAASIECVVTPPPAPETAAPDDSAAETDEAEERDDEEDDDEDKGRGKGKKGKKKGKRG